MENQSSIALGGYIRHRVRFAGDGQHRNHRGRGPGGRRWRHHRDDQQRHAERRQLLRQGDRGQQQSRSHEQLERVREPGDRDHFASEHVGCRGGDDRGLRRLQSRPEWPDIGRKRRNDQFHVLGQVHGHAHGPNRADLVDGHGSGNAGAEWPNDGTDHMSRAAATGALNVVLAYENNKLANNGDANYALYDSLLLSAHMYTINSTGTAIQFDPNAPGYAFIPGAAFDALAVAQDSKEVASNLVSGLASCFATTNGAEFYQFKANALKGYTQHATLTGTVPGWTPPSGSNVSNPIDNYTITSSNLPNGATGITMTLTSSHDYWFGALAYNNINIFPNSSKVTSKFTGGTVAGCSPFNGPGGIANPHWVITLNGQTLPARLINSAQQCNNPGCTSTLVVDPDAYAVAGPDTNANGVVGPTISNPFPYDTSTVECTPDHYGQYACYTNQSNSYVCGMFSAPVVKRNGVVAGYAWLQCGTSGAGC